MAKIVPKRTTLLQKLAYILRPFVLYMLVKTFAMLFFAIFIPSLPIAGIAAWVEANSYQLSAVVNALAAVIATAFLLNDFLIEVNTSGEIDIDRSVFGQYLAFLRKGFWGVWDVKKAVSLIACTVLGASAAFCLNRLVALATFSSEKYEAVETIQYSVPVWLGLILYGLVSPMVEEMVFRGIIYSRIKKFYGIPAAVLFSALLFGAFHGNLPQFVYGTAMGILMAACQEYSGCFAAPVFVHMSANIFAFLYSV